MEDMEKKVCNCGHEDCDCEGHDCDCMEEDIVELTTDDGKKLKFFFVGTIEYKGKAYAEQMEIMSKKAEDAIAQHCFILER